jgi:hypothetical protein
MATKKSILVLFGILVISAWVLGSAIQVGAETLKFRAAVTATKNETMAVGDVEGHILAMQTWEGLAFCDSGETAKVISHNISDFTPGKGAQTIGYVFVTFEDGSTIEVRTQRLWTPGQSGTGSGTGTTEIIKGTGRFEGIKGTGSSTGKFFPPSKGEAARVTQNSILTYTLPPK